MHEKDSFAFIQFVENGIESFVSHVNAIGVREDAKPDGTEGVESIINFSYRVWDRGERERGKEAEVIRVGSADFRKLDVGGA
jgi:hypothetical protein